MKLLFTSLFAGFLFASYSQQKLVAFEVDNKGWGYCTPEGEIVIPPRYFDAHSFNPQGTALVRTQEPNSMWLLLNTKGEIIPLPYDSFDPYGFFDWGKTGFRSSVIIVKVKKKSGCVNGKGEIVHNLEFDHIRNFTSNYTIAEIGKQFYILDIFGNRYEVPDAEDLKPVRYGYAPYRVGDYFGLVDSTGHTLVKPQFRKVGYLIGGFAWARNDKGLIGYIDRTGEWIIEPRFERATNPDTLHHISIARVENQVFLNYSNGETLKVDGIIDADGFYDGVSWARKGDKFGFIDHQGEWIIEPVYEKVYRSLNGIIRVKKGALMGAYTTDGKMILPCEYDHIEELSDGMIAIRKRDLWGYADETGKLVVDFQFDGIRNFKNGYAAVKKGFFWGLINKQGNFTIEPKYRRLKDVEIIE